MDSAVNFTTLAERLEGYTGSDIKEVCREAVVRVAHERAHILEHGAVYDSPTAATEGARDAAGKDSVVLFVAALCWLRSA